MHITLTQLKALSCVGHSTWIEQIRITNHYSNGRL